MNITPDRIYEAVAQTIKGQDEYVKTLATLAWLQMLRYKNRKVNNRADGKINALVIGASGTGKTATVKAVSEYVKLSVFVADITSYTGTGWKGRDLNEMIEELLVLNNYDTEKTSYSIVALDEFDKLFHSQITEDSSFSVISNLLKFIEGVTVTVKTKDNKDYTINTENMLFLCMGAFDGLEDIIKKRIQPDNVIGFCTTEQEETADNNNILKQVTEEDLINYGASSQIVGRMNTICVLNSLTQETLQEIITQSHNSPIKSLNRLINTTQNVKISITDSATQAIANEAIQKDTGTRSLYNTIYTLLIPYIYRVPSQNIDELQIDTDESSTLYVKEVRQQGGRCLLCGVDIADITVTEPYIDYK